jgi:VanZ like protein
MIEQLTQTAGLMAYPQLALWPAVIAIVVLCPLAWSLATALRGSRVSAVAAAVCLSAAVTVTTARPGLGSATADWSRIDSACVVTDARTMSTEARLNLLLLVPFAVVAVLAVGRPILVALFATLASIAIEAVQAAYSVGACDSSDLVRNTAGASVAALLTAAVRTVVRTAARIEPPHLVSPSPASSWAPPWEPATWPNDPHETRSQTAILPVTSTTGAVW